MDQVQAFTPILNHLGESEMERNEKECEKEMNMRKKRTTRGRRGVALPDREPIKTLRTPAFGFSDVDPAVLALAQAAAAFAGSRLGELPLPLHYLLSNTGRIREWHGRHHTHVALGHTVYADSFCTEGDDERILYSSTISADHSSPSCTRFSTNNVHHRVYLESSASSRK